jgi:type 1 fimbria pilin
MLRIVVGFLSLCYGAMAFADARGYCTYSNIEFTSQIFTDPAVAPIGSAIGSLTATATGTCPQYSGGGSQLIIGLGMAAAPLAPGFGPTCQTSVPGIGIQGSPCYAELAYDIGLRFAYFALPTLAPETHTRVFTYIKTGTIPPGVHTLTPYRRHLSEFIRHPNNGINFYPVSGYQIPPGEVVGTTCSLVNPDILVDFGTVSETGIERPFAIEFGNCTNQADAVAYNAAISLRFKSERINTNGSALNNNTCPNCSSNIQIALKDGNGKPVDLSKAYKLSNHGSTEVSPTGLTYKFLAALQDIPGTKATPGIIDTQLVFETAIE